MWRRLVLTVWLGAMAMAVVFITITSTGRGTPFGDFDKAYYPAGIAARIAPSDLYACGNDDGLCFVNLPLVAAAFIPIGALSRHAAHIVVVVVSAASVLATIALLARLVRARGAAAFAVATVVLLNGPLHYSMRLGNLTHVVLTALVAAILALRGRHHVTAGVLLAVCALIKPPFLIWLPALVVRPRWRPAAVAMGATLGAAVLMSVALFGLPLHLTWFSQFVAESNARPLGAYNVQSISGALVRLTTSVYLVEWVGVEISPALRLFQLGLTAACGLIAGLALWFGRGESDDDLIAEQTIVIALMLLISPISWTHYYAFLLIPIAWWATVAATDPRMKWACPVRPREPTTMRSAA